MKVFVTGVGGQLGHDVINELDKRGHTGIGSDIHETYSGIQDNSAVTKAQYVSLDITNEKDVMDTILSIKPDAIIHCAAWTAVDLAEDDDKVEKVRLVNVKGTENIAKAAKAVNCKCLYLSTDYVFAGTEAAPRTEFDTPDPISAYGKTKLEGERFVEQFAKKYFILRTAWLYGDGKNFIKTMVRLSKTHDEVSVVCDQFGSPTSAVELAKMIHFLEPTENYGTFHATCEGETNWADFTDVFFAKLGITTKVNHITSEEYARMYPDAARRPAYSNLDNYMLRLTTDQFAMAHWEDALDVYLKDLDVDAIE